MRTKILAFFSIFVSCVASAWAGNLTLDEQTIDFGEKYQFTEIDHDLTVWNRSSDAITFYERKPLKSSATLTFDQPTLAPGKSTQLHLKLALEDRTGVFSTRVPIETLEGGKIEQYEILIRGYVDSILDDARPGLNLGVVEARDTSTEKSIALSSSSDPRIRITRILETPDFLDARIDDDGHKLTLKPKKFDVLGYSTGFVKVILDSKQQPQAWVKVVMDMRGNVVPDQNPLGFDLQRPKTLHPIRLQLSSRDSKPFRVGKIAADEALHVSIVATECLPKPRGDCHAYLLTIKQDQPHGQILGKVGFELPDTHQLLNVNLGGIYLADETAVHSLNEALEGNADAKQTQVPKKADIAQSLQKAVSDETQTSPPGEGPLLKWQVANEAGMYGYAVYRSDAVDAHFTRVNDAIVKSRNGGDDTTATYEWRDTSAVKGHEYWYYITIFYNNGKKVQLTGPQKVMAK